MNDLSINGMEKIVEKLLLKQQHLADVINWLSSLKISCEIPGLDAEDIALSVEGNVLRISKKGCRPGKNDHRDQLIGRCGQIKTISGLADNMADREENITLQGDTGAGKSFMAAYIHNRGKRRGEPLLRVPATSLVDKAEIAKQVKNVGKGTLYISNLEDLDTLGQENLWQELNPTTNNPLLSSYCWNLYRSGYAQ